MNPIIIIGAPRSGTNLLRNILTSFNGASTWGCDEIPYIWRYGNKEFPTDILTPEMVTPKIKKYIRNHFEKISRKMKCNYVIEKTCANSLRVDYLDKIQPNAKYIYIKRNGIDAVYSIMKRWNAQVSYLYTLRKLKYVPLSSIPYYGFHYINNRFYKMRNKNRLKFWGPRFTKTEELSNLSLEEVSAKQWVACVDRSNASFKKIDPSRVYKLTYENFVTSSQDQIEKMAEFIGVSFEDNIQFPSVNDLSIGKGLRNLSTSQIELIKPIIKRTMIENKYPCV